MEFMQRVFWAKKIQFCGKKLEKWLMLQNESGKFRQARKVRETF